MRPCGNDNPLSNKTTRVKSAVFLHTLTDPRSQDPKPEEYERNAKFVALCARRSYAKETWSATRGVFACFASLHHSLSSLPQFLESVALSQWQTRHDVFQLLPVAPKERIEGENPRFGELVAVKRGSEIDCPIAEPQRP